MSSIASLFLITMLASNELLLQMNKRYLNGSLKKPKYIAGRLSNPKSIDRLNNFHRHTAQDRNSFI